MYHHHQLYNAAFLGDLEQVKHCIERGTNINTTNQVCF